MRAALLAAALLFAVCGAVKAAAPSPELLYTDLLSGPNRGGENDSGIYLSVFGKNFGATGLGSTVKVFVGDREVDNYRYLGRSKGRPDIQQITVQVGALGNPAPGKRMPVKVVVDGRSSNTNESCSDANPELCFMVSPGRILFVDNVDGNDLTAVVGDSAKSFRHLQLDPGKVGRTQLGNTAWEAVRAGDSIVLRGRQVPWTDSGIASYFIRFQPYPGASPPMQMGLPPTGALGTGPITLLGYPGEDVFISKPFESGATGAISGSNKANQARGNGSWVVISNLRVESGGPDGVVNTQAGSVNSTNGGNWRIVNNELTAATAVANLNALSGGIEGDGKGHVFLGNHIHDIFHGPDGGGRLQHHGIYLTSTGSYEIAYNRIERIRGGNGIQLYSNGTSGSPFIDNVSIHHNVIRGAAKHGINVADGSRGNIAIWNNVVADSDQCGIRFNSGALSGARIYNNTFHGSDALDTSTVYRAMICNDERLKPDAMAIRNNIFVAGGANRKYAGGSTGFEGSVGSMSNNLWFRGSGPVPGTGNVSADPLFINPAAGNFRLQASSPAKDAGSSVVSDLVIDDYDVATESLDRVRRPLGRGYDIGAFER